jgi:hypothetical protein
MDNIKNVSRSGLGSTAKTVKDATGWCDGLSHDGVKYRSTGRSVCGPRPRYLRPSVTCKVSVIHFNKHNRPTEHNMTILLAVKMFRNYSL